MEVLETVLDATLSMINPGSHLDSDEEELEAALRLELIDIARASGVSDPVALKDILLATIPGIPRGEPSECKRSRGLTSAGTPDRRRGRLVAVINGMTD